MSASLVKVFCESFQKAALTKETNKLKRRIDRLEIVNNSLFISLTEKEAEIQQLLAGKSTPETDAPTEAPPVKRERMMHFLKIRPEFLAAVKDGSKTFEVRRSDRDFRPGDFLFLHEFDNGAYLPGHATCLVTYLLDDPDYVKDGFVVMGIRAF